MFDEAQDRESGSLWLKSSASALALVMAMSLPTLASPPGDFPFGVYDPDGYFEDEPDVQIEHLFLPWEDVFLQSLSLADSYASERGRAILVTVEPWTWTRGERQSPEALQRGILRGDYDINMRAICDQLSQFSSPVTVRWGHEMEFGDGQFIWTDWDPDLYIRAYKRAIDICREVSNDIQYMWSPLGDEGLEEYYPGDDYVDVVGLSVFGFEPYERAFLGGPQTFRDILTPRYERVLQFNKPIVVAELGYSGSPEYVARWENDVRQDLDGFDELRAVVYFNQKEVYPWPGGFGLPDWRFEQNILPQN
ncbi:glycoside hydrolase family 26 protein [Aestuariivita boseongensis]|uniref:glycoside hydrolase family 26 protein n=1 Tax=Aestuariivita boseongensis TaxID=1470562 RepID=UPI000683740C|nr:glycosyl hydrolase [Aestuariivita boseongensis]